MTSPRTAWFVAISATLLLASSRAPAAPAEILITAAGVEPRVFRAVAGQRVEFMKRVDAPVHAEFGWDPGQHHVYQIPGTGPVWAIFHRPGTHRYVVHIYRGNAVDVLHGIVEVVEDPRHPWGPGSCGAVVMGDCLEP
jgi:hypothetical protein